METGRTKNIIPNKYYNQPKEILNKSYLNVSRGDEPEVIKAKLKDPDFKLPPDINLSLPSLPPQIEVSKKSRGLVLWLENLLGGQNKNPYSLLGLWNYGNLDDVKPDVYLGREYTLSLMKDAGIEPLSVETQTITTFGEPTKTETEAGRPAGSVSKKRRFDFDTRETGKFITDHDVEDFFGRYMD